MLKSLEGPLWVALGTAIFFLSYGTGIGSLSEPGAGFVSLASGLFLIAIGAIMIMVRRRGSQKEAPESGQPAAPKAASGHFFRLIRLVMLLFLYALLLNPLGYVITTFLVMFGLFHDSGKRRFTIPLLASLACVAATYTVFEIWLRCQLPRGIFPWW